MAPSLLEAAAPELVALVVSGLVVLYGWEKTSGFRQWVDRHVLRRQTGSSTNGWDWRVVALAVGIVFVAAAFVQSAPIPCSVGEDDTLALLQSGRHLLTGANPLITTQCGHTVLVPYGMASAVLDALGSLGGRAGIWLVWNLVALLLIPLTWVLAGAHRRYATIFVATSVLYAPLVVGSIQGGHSAVVPVTALLGIWLALRRNPAAGVVGGFLSTVKFPSLFPFWGGLSGAEGERWRALLLSVFVFGGLTVAVFLLWGAGAYSQLFGQQLTRADFSINEFGVLIPIGAMPPSSILEAIQGVSLFGAILFVHLRKWSAVPAVALLTVVVALVAQRFTANFMVWLIPVALLGPSYARWLFALGAVGFTDASVALPLCMSHGACGASEGLGGLFGLLLLGLLLQILRTESRSGAGPSGSQSGLPTSELPATQSGTGSSSPTFQSGPRFEGRGHPDRHLWSEPSRIPPPDG